MGIEQCTPPNLSKMTSGDLRKEYPDLDIWLPGDKVKSVLYQNVPPKLVSTLGEKFGSDNLLLVPKSTIPGDIGNLLLDRDVRIIAGRSELKLTPSQIEKAEGLSLIAKCCVGVDGVDFRTAAEKGIMLINSPHAATNAVAELTIFHALNLVRQTAVRGMDTVLGKSFKKSSEGCLELGSMKIGIVGAGNIGRESARKFLGLGVEEVSMYNDGPNADEKIQQVLGAKKVESLEELLERSDIVVVHTDDKNHEGKTNDDLITAERLKGKNVFAVINMARGKIVRVEELKKAIDAGYIQRAAVDVFDPSQEKAAVWQSPVERELVEAGTFFGTPHVGASTQETQSRIAEDIYRKIWGNIAYGNMSHGVNFRSDEIRAGSRRDWSIIFQHITNLGTMKKLLNAVSDAGVDINGTQQDDISTNGKGKSQEKLPLGITRFDTDRINESQVGAILEKVMARDGAILQRIRVTYHPQN